ncbi:MAG: hypothetical protein MJ016_04525 [Victivallaceae bacterium]|nr:hypothetical protein [Victivallaceae bacterium]
MKSVAGHYYDFDEEPQIGNWNIVFQDGTCFRAETLLSGVSGYQVIATPAEPTHGYHRIVPHTLLINGEKIDLNTQAEPYYSWINASRFGVRRFFDGSDVRLILEFSSPESAPLEFLHIALLDDFSVVPPPEKVRREIPFPADDLILPEFAKNDVSNWEQGIVSEGKAGRFGFVKGDGLLDVAMPYLGVVDKMYLCGLPEYQKPFRWSYRILPDGMPLHGDLPVATVKSADDKIEVNRLSVSWEAQTDKNVFSCRYSIAGPGIVVRDSRNRITLSDLEYASNYQYVLIPKSGGAEVRTLESLRDLEMAANYLLFFGATEFPDVPLLVVLTRLPKSLEVARDPRTNRLTEIVFHGVDCAITATPFGIESFPPISPRDEKFIKAALRRCRFWSRALLAMPVSVREFYRIDREKGEVSITEKFDYLHISDEWGTVPLEIAPLPPVLSHCGIARHQGEMVGFPTKYGELTAVAGNEATYTIPLADAMRSFPLREEKNDSVGKLLADGLKEYLDFTEKFADDIQAYPYAGALLEPFAMASTMLNFMPEAEKKALTEKIANRLKLVNDVKRSYVYPAVDWGEMMRLMPDDEKVLEIYRDPALPRKKLWNYYERTERFTHQSYFICYLNLCLFNVEKVLKTGTPEEIARVVFPLIENDWGVGLTFYYLYLAMLATGSTREIRKNWQNIKKMNAYFELFHDWACMASGYAENALAWVEGANYGVFTVFPHLAHAVGDAEAEKFALYLGAKQLALRASQLRAGTHYFNRYMHTGPFRFWKYYRSESNPAFDFQSLPKMWRNRAVDDALYNGTTEGLYPEYFLDMQKVLPDEFARTIGCYRDALMRENTRKSWTMIQQFSSVLLAEALDENIPEETVLKDLDFAEKNGMLFHEWRGIHVFSRRLPKNYFESQIRAFLLLRRQPLALLRWINCAVRDAVWDPGLKVARIVLEKAGTRCGEITLRFKRPPERIRLDGAEVDFTESHGMCTVLVQKPGTMEIYFK